MAGPDTAEGRESLFQDSKDIGRSKFEWIYLGKDALMRMLGAPAADKKAVLLDTAHDVSEKRADMVREVVVWFDKYLGKVN